MELGPTDFLVITFTELELKGWRERYQQLFFYTKNKYTSNNITTAQTVKYVIYY